MTDIEKMKIDILRDALKDASDTIRALDRKINFLVSYNTFILGILITIFVNYDRVINMTSEYKLFFFILGFLSLLWILNTVYTMRILSPYKNPNEAFSQKKDKDFGNNTFFVNATKKLELDNLLDNYARIKSEKSIEKLLYKEIGKVSYIRDSKIKSIKISVNITLILSFFFFCIIGWISWDILSDTKDLLPEQKNKKIKTHTTTVITSIRILEKNSTVKYMIYKDICE